MSAKILQICEGENKEYNMKMNKQFLEYFWFLTAEFSIKREVHQLFYEYEKILKTNAISIE